MTTITEKSLATLRWLLQRPRLQKRAIVFSVDLVLLISSIWIAYFLRLGVWTVPGDVIAKVLVGALSIMIPTFFAFGVYRAIFRYAGAGMMRTLGRALALYGLGMALVYTVVSIDNVPRTVGVIQPMVFALMVFWTRTTSRNLLLHLLGQNNYGGDIRKVLIYGAGSGGQQLATSLHREPAFQVCGFLDDDKRLHGQKLDGDKVYWSGQVDELIRRLGVTDIYLAMPSLPRSGRRKIIEALTNYRVNVQTLPTLADVAEGRVSYTDIRPVAIEDLLGREPVTPNDILLGRTILGKTVLVTGAGGSIGSELCRQIVRIGAKRLVMLDQSEFALYSIDRELSSFESSVELVPLLGSVSDQRRLDAIFAEEQIDTIYHAAAYKHVPLVQANPIEAIHNNVVGTLRLVTTAHLNNVSNFILISTDKAVRPTNVMGASKRCAEQILQAFAKKGGAGRYSMVRFGNVLGSSGSVVPLFREQIEAGGPLTLTHKDITRFFMTIPEAANLVIQAAGLAGGGEVFVLDMGKPVKIYNLARTMINLSGLSVRDSSNPDGDIEIQEIGLRPGEKLYEELLIGSEPTKTNHPRILKAHESFLEWEQLSTKLAALKACNDPIQAAHLLKEIVPEFANRRDDLGVGKTIAR